MSKLEKFQKCINFALEELGDGLIATDIYSDEGLPIVDGYNSNPKAIALFSGITENLRDVIKNSNFPELGDYYVINLKENSLDIVILNSKFQWKLLVDTSKIKLGYLFSVFLPMAIEKFKEATTIE